jgi:hypothetical protein
MSIKLVLLKSGEQIISDAKEIVTQDKETGERDVHGYLFEKPHKVSIRTEILLTEDTDDNSRDIQVAMTPWIVLSSDDKVTVPTDWVVTIVEPLESIKEMYEEKVNGKID